MKKRISVFMLVFMLMFVQFNSVFARNMVIFCDPNDEITDYILDDSRTEVIVDFADVKTFDSCLQKLGKAFGCSVFSEREITSSNFLFCLPKFDNCNINLIIKNFYDFSVCNREASNRVINMFERSILPFWDNPFEYGYEDAPKGFDIYVEDVSVD